MRRSSGAMISTNPDVFGFIRITSDRLCLARYKLDRYDLDRPCPLQNL